MAALVLSLAGAALGGSFGAAGAVAGRLAGALAGAVIDRALFGARPPDGPRLKDLDVLSSTEGAPIPRVYGRMRVAGQVIWATALDEQASGGGKGSPRGRSYSYTANLAVGLCEGPIAGIGRIWADGKELDQAGLTIRVHRGTGDQAADPLIVAKEGAGDTPAYRGLAYIVFERLPLDDFGSRIPQLTCEVMRPVGRLEPMVRALVVIPGATEFGYDPGIHVRDFGFGRSAPETRHSRRDGADITVALDEAQALCPNLESVSLVVAWFGDDLRAGACTIAPAVERRDKEVTGLTWGAAGQTRETARLVSEVEGRPAYGGSPSDATVIRAIAALKARGLKVTLIPFVMMDVPAGNGLPDPVTGAAGQPPHPWRGRITCTPAPGRPGSPDGGAAAADEIDAFLGTAAASDFTVTGDTVAYAGPDEWRYRRFILHMAALAKAAGGVDAFLVGSEMVGLTRVRGAAGHPFVDGLAALAADVRALLPEAMLSYAADWTEYGGQARGADLDFPLDPLWASEAIGAVGIDWYAPLADHRDDMPDAPYDGAALAAGFAAGEGFDWYYASDLARAAGTRTPITDGLGKPWVFRQKDLVSWWSQRHRPRVGGVETAPTAWVPMSKPIWLTELGFPAVDRGANRPSVFPDPKSSESGLPPFSSGDRDDLIQRRALEAVLSRLDPAFGATLAANPVSPLYGGRMIDPACIALWAFDARPWPAFPRAGDIWADGTNWETGHWLNGRLGAAPVGDLMRAVLADHGIAAVEADTVEGVLDGFSIDRPMTARDALEGLARAFGVDGVERGEGLVLLGRAAPAVAVLTTGDLVEEEERATLAVTRGETQDLPAELSVAFAETDADFRATAVTSRRIAGGGSRVSGLSLSAAADPGEMTLRAEALLHRLWASRDRAAFALPPSALRFEPGDAVTIAGEGGAPAFRLTGLEGGLMRRAEAESLAAPVRARRPRPARRAYDGPAGVGRPAVAILALPPLTEAEPAPLAFCAAAADPWRGPYSVWRGGEGLGDTAVGTLERPSLMGRTLTALAPGRPWRWDRGGGVTVELVTGALAGQPEAAVLDGANAMALRHPDGGWEVLQFRDAMLVADRTYLLSRLMRGQRGTEHRTGPVPPGAVCVLLGGPLVSLGTGLDLVGRPFRYRIGSAVLLAADPAVAQVDATADLTALTPFAPVHARARREAEGIRIAWTRRTRLGGDGWDVAEIGLGEAAERYRLTILDADGTPLRSVETTAPFHLYVAAEEIADFGAPQALLRLTVAQVSAIAGPGHALDVVIAL
ncbi:MAG: glycoside hydrolase/phage tail family protein [Phreatobacter sp.]|uniref:baseplate multidomain protein megatron n=1 Tax=Phreatobacter sp. TaxID=1966341 RepID=UPI0027354E15|nr:glycoside hydrolase/phage tail family protein [Phreatobacter sp.]MDP2800409.1 glycoside hydrolase/phage tail family protein [Phreatobacter sp.]